MAGLPVAGVSLLAEGSKAFTSGLEAGEKAVKSFVGATEQGSKGVSAFGQIAIGALRQVGAAAVQAAAEGARAIGAFVVDSVKQAGDFESGMLRFGSVTGSAIKEAGMSLEDFSELFLQLGADTQFSAAQAQEAAINLAKGGLTPAMIAGGALADTLQLAAAGELELATAADITAKQLGVWADQGVTSANVANLLAQAANASVVSVEELALGMANVGGVAKLAGASFQDTVTALGAVSAGFSSASDAGTSMKAFLQKLQPATKPAIAAFRELNLLTADGTSKFYDAQGNFVGFSKAAELLKGSLEGLTKAQQSQVLQTIFGADGIRVAALLAEKGAAGFDAFAASMGSTGTAAEQAAAKNQGFNFALETLFGSLDTLKVVLGTAILPLLTSFINEGLTPGINAVMEFTGTFTKLIPTILASTDPINTFFNALRVAAPEAVPQINAIQNAFDGIIGPINAVQTALVTFGQTEWGQSIQRGGQVVSDYFAGPFQTDITNGIAVVQQALVTFGATPWGTELQQGASVAAAYFANDFPVELSRGISVVQQALDTLGASPWATGLQQGASTVGTYFANDFPGELQRGTTLVMTELDKMAASPWYTAFLTNSRSVTTYMVNDFPTELARGINLVITTLDELAASPWYTEFLRVSGLVTTFMTTAFPTQISAGVTAAVKAVNGFVEDFKKAGKALVDGIIAGVQSAATALAGAVGQVVSDAVEAARAALRMTSPSRVTAQEIGVPFVQGIVEGIQNSFDLLKSMAKVLSKNLTEVMKNVALAAVKSFREVLTQGLQAQIDLQSQDISNIDTLLDLAGDSDATNRAKADYENLLSDRATADAQYNVDRLTADQQYQRDVLAGQRDVTNKVAELRQKLTDEEAERNRKIAEVTATTDFEENKQRKIAEIMADYAPKLRDIATSITDVQMEEATRLRELEHTYLMQKSQDFYAFQQQQKADLAELAQLQTELTRLQDLQAAKTRIAADAAAQLKAAEAASETLRATNATAAAQQFSLASKQIADQARLQVQLAEAISAKDTAEIAALQEKISITEQLQKAQRDLLAQQQAGQTSPLEDTLKQLTDLQTALQREVQLDKQRAKDTDDRRKRAEREAEAVQSQGALDQIVALISQVQAGIGVGTGQAITATLASALEQAVAQAQQILGIHSPSTVFADKVGKPAGMGVVQGFASMLPQLGTVLAKSVAAPQMVSPVQTSSSTSSRSYTDASTVNAPMNINTNVSEARLEAIISRVLDRRTGRASSIKATGGYAG